MMNERYYSWMFKCLDGEILYAKYTNNEIRELERKYPEVKWDWGL